MQSLPAAAQQRLQETLFAYDTGTYTDWHDADIELSRLITTANTSDTALLLQVSL
jgi:hypothetical protein